jgi:uncharacterized membrane protein
VADGLLLVLVKPSTIVDIVRALTQHELSEDPHDFVATHVLHASSTLNGASLTFAAIYLFSHRVLKIVPVGRRASKQDLGLSLARSLMAPAASHAYC